MKAVLSTLAALAFMAVPALADPTYNWSGFYLGAQAGYAWGNATSHDDPKDWGTDPKFIGPFDFNLSGAVGGAHAGYNFVVGPLIIGPEVDFGYMDLAGSRKTDSSNPTKYQTLNVDGGMYALAGGRVGFAWDRTLFYGKGGWVWYDTDVTQTTTNPGYKTNGSGALNGWAYGGGIEQALGHGWSVKTEWLHFNFDTANGDQTSVSDPPIGYVYKNWTESGADTVQVGFSYKLGGDDLGPLK